MESRREQWRKRVQRWQDSGLTAEEFAQETGLNVGTLRHWKYTLDKEVRGAHRAEPAERPGAEQPPRRPQPTLPLVEVQTTAGPADGRFKVELARGRRLRVPASFEAQALRRLLLVLEERP